MADPGSIELRVTHDERMSSIAWMKAVYSCGGARPQPRRTFGVMPLVLRAEENWDPVVYVRLALVDRP